MTDSQILDKQRADIASMIETLLPYRDLLAAIIARQPGALDNETRLLYAGANITLQILSYTVFKGVGRQGLLDAMAAHVGAKLKGGADSQGGAV